MRSGTESGECIGGGEMGVFGVIGDGIGKEESGVRGEEEQDSGRGMFVASSLFRLGSDSNDATVGLADAHQVHKASLGIREAVTKEVEASLEQWVVGGQKKQ
jgi:hypothetical protein